MAQASWRRAFVAVLGTSLMILGGCGTGRNTEIEDSWMARVPEEQLGDVREAQALRRQTSDEVTRANVAIGDAERALEVARRSAEAAKLRKDAAKVQLEAARETGQQDSILAAEAQLQVADLELAAAQAQVDWRKENVEAWKAQRELREREFELADAELNYAQYQALKENEDVRARSLTEGDFLSLIADAKRETLEARRAADERTQRAQQMRAQWEQLRERVQGYGGSGRDRR